MPVEMLTPHSHFLFVSHLHLNLGVTLEVQGRGMDAHKGALWSWRRPLRVMSLWEAAQGRQLQASGLEILCAASGFALPVDNKQERAGAEPEGQKLQAWAGCPTVL